MSAAAKVRAVAAACAVALTAGEARATGASLSEFRPFQGTTRYDAAAQGAFTNARVFGVTGVLERRVLPNLVSEDATLFLFENNLLLNAIRVPGYCIDQNVCGQQLYQTNYLDFFASSFALGRRFGPVSVYYISSATGSAFPTDWATRSFAYGFGVPLVSAGYGLVAPALGNRGGLGLGKINYDFLLGGQVDVGAVNLSAGYLGSKGLVTNITQEKLRLFLTAALTEGLKSAPLIKGGLDRLPLPGDLRSLGLTSLYGRKLELVPPQPVALAQASAKDELRAGSLDFVSAHFEQLSLARVLDVVAAYGVKPYSFLHEARVGLHTPEFHAPRPTKETVKEGNRSGGVTGGVGLSVGMVQLPSLPAYGVEGGRKLSLSFDVVAGIHGSGGDDGVLRLSVQRNSPDVLAMFPFAYDAWNVYFTVGFGSDEVESMAAWARGKD